MTAAALAKTATPILRSAAGEPPLGAGGEAFRADQGEMFFYDHERSPATRIGVLELEDGTWLSFPFGVDRMRYQTRAAALRAGIAAMVRKARRYMRNAEGDGTHWSEGFAGRVAEWALGLKPARESFGRDVASFLTKWTRVINTDIPDHEAGIPATEEITPLANAANGLAAESASEEITPQDGLGITDPIVAELVAAHRARKTYPAGHTFSMTNPVINGHMVTLGSCSCGDTFSYPYGSAGHEKMDAAIEAHRQKFDAIAEKIDGRGQPIARDEYLEGITANAKKPRRKNKEVVAQVETSESDGDLSKWCDIISQMGSQPGAGGLPAPLASAPTADDTPGADAVTEAAPIGAGSVAQQMAASPGDDWSPLLNAALDLAWREPPPVTAQLKALLDFSKVYGGEVERPPLRWHGSKWRLAPWIMSYFPEHRIYVEPFGGGASVLLRKRRSYAEIYNDLDREVVSFFRILQDPEQSARLIELLYVTPFSREEFELGYAETLDPVERARRLVIRAFMGHGSDSMAGVISGFRANSNRSGTTPAHDWVNYVPALPLVIERMRGVVVEQREAIDVMTRHDAETALHYVDPPYLPETRSWMTSGKGKGNYRHELDPEGHAALLAALNDLTGMVVLSGYPSELYDAALTDWRRVETVAFADGARPRTEVLWLNPACVAALDQQHPALFDIAALDAVNTPPRT